MNILESFHRLFPWSTSEQLSFFYRLATYLGAGVPLLEALNLLANTSTQTTTRIAQKLSSDIAEGMMLSESIIRHTTHLHPLAQPILTVGERSGTLPECLSDLGTIIANQQTLQKNLIGACIYPALIVCGTVGIGFFLLTYVFPTILPLLRGLGGDIPIATRILIDTSSFFQNNWLLLLSALILTVGIYLYLKTYSTVRVVHDAIILKTPLLGGLLRTYTLAHITHTLHLLLKHNVPLPEGLHLCINTTQNHAFRESLTQAAIRISEGELLSDTLAQYPHLFPQTYTQLIAVGERTGSLPSLLETLYNHHTKEFADTTQRILTLIEPVLMLIMGIVVGYIALAIIMPVYQLSSSMYQ